MLINKPNIQMKIRILLLLVLYLSFVSAVPLQAQQGLLILEKGSVKVIGPEHTRLLRKNYFTGQ